MCLFRVLILACAVIGAADRVVAEASERALRFDVTDQRRTITREIDSELLLRAVRIPHSRVAHFGWEIQVVLRSTSRSGGNLLRHPALSQGPHPSDVLAWLTRRRYFADDRTVPVPGHPYQVRIRLIECRTEETGEDVGFVSGTIEVSWQRLDRAESGHLAGSGEQAGERLAIVQHVVDHDPVPGEQIP